MNQETKKHNDCEDEDENTIAKSIIDEIIEETENDKEPNQEEPANAPPLFLA